MIKIDEKFLDEVGLTDLPEEKKPEFIEQTQEELENRVGERMSEGLTLNQLQEFEGIMNNDRNAMIQILSQIGDYRNDPIYIKILQRHGVTEGNLQILGEYLSVKWIQINRPDYAAITADVEAQLKNEIIQARDRILAAF